MGGQLYLASTSPRRRDLLRAAGLPFTLHPPGPEPAGEGAPRDLALQRARHKAVGAPAPERPGWILGVDTVVAHGSQEFGKPADRTEAIRMLMALRGREHEVYSGHVLVEAAPADGAAPRMFEELTQATVWCREFGDQELEDYLATGDWADKAGGYGIQGPAGAFMSLRQGVLDTVIGLHVAAVERLLEAGS